MRNIPKKRYYSIQDLCQYCDIQPYTLRYWEKKTNLITPVRLSNNRRRYTKDCFEKVTKLNYLIKIENLSLQEAVKHLEEDCVFSRVYLSTLDQIEAIVSE